MKKKLLIRFIALACATLMMLSMTASQVLAHKKQRYVWDWIRKEHKRLTYGDYGAFFGWVDVYYSYPFKGAYKINEINNHIYLNEGERSLNMHQQIFSNYKHEAPQVLTYLGPTCTLRSRGSCFRYMTSDKEKASKLKNWFYINIDAWNSDGDDLVRLHVWIDNKRTGRNVGQGAIHVHMP